VAFITTPSDVINRSASVDDNCEKQHLPGEQANAQIDGVIKVSLKRDLDDPIPSSKGCLLFKGILTKVTPETPEQTSSH
jgi:hypothetical protein